MDSVRGMSFRARRTPPEPLRLAVDPDALPVVPVASRFPDVPVARVPVARVPVARVPVGRLARSLLRSASATGGRLLLLERLAAPLLPDVDPVRFRSLERLAEDSLAPCAAGFFFPEPSPIVPPFVAVFPSPEAETPTNLATTTTITTNRATSATFVPFPIAVLSLLFLPAGRPQHDVYHPGISQNFPELPRISWSYPEPLQRLPYSGAPLFTNFTSPKRGASGSIIRTIRATPGHRVNWKVIP